MRSLSRRTRNRLVLAGLVFVVLPLLCYGWWRHRYPYGWSHCCDKNLMLSLRQYAEDHGGAFPAGGDTPEASLSLLYPDYVNANLLRGNPVIVRIHLPGGTTHFVVVCGKQGFDYLIRDPGAGAAKGLYPLRELGSNIEALRFYEPLKPIDARVAAQH